MRKFPISLARLTQDGQLFRATTRPRNVILVESEEIHLVLNGLLHRFQLGGTDTSNSTFDDALQEGKMLLASIEYLKIPWLADGMKRVIEANKELS